jgi:hypothetical protein
MTNHVSFLPGVIYILIGQVLVWFQTNAQFLWPKSKEYTLPISMVGGVLISYLFIKGVGLMAEAANGEIWPSRVLPSSTGIIIFAILTWLLLGQGISAKTGICIVLSFCIIAIQIFWK